MSSNSVNTENYYIIEIARYIKADNFSEKILETEIRMLLGATSYLEQRVLPTQVRAHFSGLEFQWSRGPMTHTLLTSK